MIFFQAWWLWIGFGLILGILEVLLTGFILLGFGLGAVLTGLVILTGIVMTLPQTFLVFAVFLPKKQFDIFSFSTVHHPCAII